MDDVWFLKIRDTCVIAYPALGTGVLRTTDPVTKSMTSDIR